MEIKKNADYQIDIDSEFYFTKIKFTIVSSKFIDLNKCFRNFISNKKKKVSCNKPYLYDRKLLEEYVFD